METDLWNEHFSRYAFAARYVAGKRVLDVGCGSGYGAAELARTAESVTGVDISAEAIAYANAHYAQPNLSFSRHSCVELPWPDAGFEIITAFEVIEHLSNWQALLSEARRLLRPDGLLLVSTPNKLYYADQRRDAGPNPFHEHEFEFGEFQQALLAYFPRVEMLLQNRTEAFVYSNPALRDAEVRVESNASEPSGAHFFLAVCGGPASSKSYVFVPSSANLLRERERHIDRLSAELGLKDKWLSDMTSQRDQLQKQHDATLAQLEERNRWALALESDLTATRDRVVALQDEFTRDQEAARQVAADYESKVAELERDVAEKTHWALDTERRLTTEIEQKGSELAEAVRLLDAAEATVEQRTRWAQELDANLQRATAQLGMIRASKWVRLGRTAGIGPQID